MSYYSEKCVKEDLEGLKIYHDTGCTYKQISAALQPYFTEANIERIFYTLGRSK